MVIQRVLPATCYLKKTRKFLAKHITIMKDYKGEKILVVKRELFDSVGAFQGISTEVEDYLPQLINPENNFFMDRGTAEEDPTHKQLIPYALFRYKGKFLHYVRGKAGGEARLHAKGSMGIGGHINPVDMRDDALGMETYMAGVKREIDEELNIEGNYSHKVIAILNDDSNEVGKVHLGVVHLVELESDQVSSGEDAIADVKFSSVDELQNTIKPNLETWSQYCAEILDQL